MYRICHVIRVVLQHTVILWLTFYLSTVKVTSALTVHVKYTAHKTTDHVVPEELNITLHAESGTLTHITLKRVHHIEPNLPVYTHNVDKDGKHTYKREELENTEGVGYYQDVSNEAVIQVTRTSTLEDEEEQLLLKGVVNIAGNKYTLTPATRIKRDGSSLSESSIYSPSSSSDETYNLIPQLISQVVLHDYIEAPPETKRKSVDALKMETPKQFPAAPLNSTSTPLNSTSTPLHSTSTPLSLSHRRRRQSQFVQNYYIDVVALADHAIYKRFQTGSGSRTDILQSMREYYAFIFNGMDLRYKSIVSTDHIFQIRLVKLIITETATAGTFTEQFRVSSKPWDEVDAQSALSAFSEFVAGSGSDMLTPYDHVMLFTGYDLTSTLSTSANTNATTGLAFTSTLCRTDGKSVSVVEDLGGFQSVDTAAHELGHSLSARHDGDGNGCSSSDRYIMASGSSQVTQSNMFNPWLFSSCSITSFTTFISSIMKTARGQTCVMSPLTISTGVPDVSNRLPGQENPPDDQCRMIYGSASRLCRGTEFGTTEGVCTSMFCFDPNTVGTCYEQTAAMGTTCGNGKLCLNGQCVHDSRAPSVNDDCVFGDQPGNAFDDTTCPDFVSSFPGYCYQALVRGRCCASCKRVYRTVSGCEYGDKMGGCAASVCPVAAVNYLEQCCGTCNYGSSFTVPPNTMQVSQSTSPSPDSPTTIQTIVNIDPGTCENNPSILINGVTCAEAVSSNPRFCYQTDVSIACCASCDEANTGVPGTEFGGERGDDDGENESKVDIEKIKEDEEQNEESEKQDQNNKQEDEEKEEEGNIEKSEKEKDDIETEGLEGDEGKNNRDQEEMVAKSHVALFIHINLGCEYGDLYPSSCQQAKSCESITTECCQTCATTVKPNNETVTGLPTSATSSLCIDQNNVLVNNMTCTAAIRLYPYYCYTDKVQQACCLSCQQKYSEIKDCEYGDHAPQKCKSIPSAKDCQILGNDCCSTCSSSAQTDIITYLSPVVIITCFHILISIISMRSSIVL